MQRTCIEDTAGCTQWGDETACDLDACTDSTSCASCMDSCPDAAASRCQAGSVSVCELQDDGCLAWGDATACPSGFCVDMGGCGVCEHACEPGEVICQQGVLHGCVADAFGCRGWDAGEPCTGGVCGGPTSCGFTIGGRVHGLVGQLSLSLNGIGQRVLEADGGYTFDEAVAQAQPYAVFVERHPSGQQCSVSHSQGNVDGANVSDVRIDCEGAPLGNLQEITYVKAHNTDPSDSFGSSAAIDGDTLVVGAPQEGSAATGVDGDGDSNSEGQAGAAYVFVRGEDGWSQQAYLKASNTGYGDRFGTVVALRGDTLAVGAIGERSNATGIGGDESNNDMPNAGAVYVFVRQGETWTQQAYIKASYPAANSQFGWSVALSGEGSWTSDDGSDDLLAVGAIYDGTNAEGINGVPNGGGDPANYSGAAYVFAREQTTWTRQAYIKASNREANDLFGASVALHGDTLAVGALWEASSGAGVDANPQDNTMGQAGAAYVYRRADGQWYEEAYLKASNPQGGDTFGDTLALSGDTLVVGTNQEDGDGSSSGVAGADNDAASNAGAAYVFTRDGGQWAGPQYLKASNTEAGDNFAYSLSLEGDVLVVGAVREGGGGTDVTGDPRDNSAPSAGAAYAFVNSSGDWVQTAYLKGLSGDEGDMLGYSVGVSGGTVVAGAASESGRGEGTDADPLDNGASSAGAAFIYEACDVGMESCLACQSSCPFVGEMQCDAGSLRTCLVGGDGCLAWTAPEMCAEGACADARTCLECNYRCTPGEALCREGAVGTCAAAPQGCFEMPDAVACAGGFCFDGVDCGVAGASQWGSAGDEFVTDAIASGTDLLVTGSTGGDLGADNLGGTDFFLTRLDADGAVLWQRQWGTPLDDRVVAVVVAPGGDIFVLGFSRVDENEYLHDLSLTKWAADGTLLWTLPWGVAADDIAGDATLSSDGQILVTGHTRTVSNDFDIFVEKRSATDGALLWANTWGSSAADSGMSIAQADGAIFVAGTTLGELGPGRQGGADGYLSRLDDAGSLQWTVQHGSSGFDLAYDLAVGSDGGIYVVGSSPRTLDPSPGVDDDAYLTKFAGDGTQLWTQHFGTNLDDVAWAVTTMPDSDVIVASASAGALAGPNQGGYDVVMSRFDANGGLRTQQQWGSVDIEEPRAVLAQDAATVQIVGFTRGSLSDPPNAGEADPFVLTVTP